MMISMQQRYSKIISILFKSPLDPFLTVPHTSLYFTFVILNSNDVKFLMQRNDSKGFWTKTVSLFEMDRAVCQTHAIVHWYNNKDRKIWHVSCIETAWSTILPRNVLIIKLEENIFQNITFKTFKLEYEYVTCDMRECDSRNLSSMRANLI